MGFAPKAQSWAGSGLGGEFKGGFGSELGSGFCLLKFGSRFGSGLRCVGFVLGSLECSVMGSDVSSEVGLISTSEMGSLDAWE